jgi:hypothetical protein
LRNVNAEQADGLGGYFEFALYSWHHGDASVGVQNSTARDSRQRIKSPPKKGEAIMPIERDHVAERLAKIESLLAEAKRRKSLAAPTDRGTAQKLCNELAEMLNELRGPSDVVRRSA